MQQVLKSAYHKVLLCGSLNHSRIILPQLVKSSPVMVNYNLRRFADQLEVKKTEETTIDIDEKNQRLGVDKEFSEKKHSYVLSFPWNFEQIVNQYESARSLPSSSYWHKFIFNNALFEFNTYFREFHQACALPDYHNMDKLLEGKLASYVQESVRKIHFHGLDIEMANLRVEQPKIKLIKVELSHGINVERSKNHPASEYNITKSSLFGAPLTTYVPKNDTRSVFDHLDSNHKPYLVAATVVIESPMKLFVQNQNYSSILFGSNDEENVKNVVRFEANVRWLDLFKILPVSDKPNFDWKITDFNNVLNENPAVSKY